ncbi:MAG: sulfite exporter TauE/SafE family protein [Casimicrobiaceae bacterium]
MGGLLADWHGHTGAFYAAATFGILLTGIFKGGLGGGPGGIAVALMSMFIPPADAAGIVLPILCAMDVFGLLAYRGRWSPHHVRVLIPGALLGIVLGSLAFGVVPVEWVRLLIGVIAVAFALNRWFDIAQRLGARPGKPGRITGFVSGAVSGLTSTMAHAGGPPLLVYLLPQRMDKTIFVGTSVVFFAIVNYVKLVPYSLLGQLSPANLGLSLLFAPLAPLGIWLGLHLERRIPEKPFYRLSYAILFATGGKLIYDSVIG